VRGGEGGKHVVNPDIKRKGRRRAVGIGIGIALVLALAGGAFAVQQGIGRKPAATGKPSVALATVQRGTLTAQDEVNGTIGYQGSFSVADQADGIYTDLPAVGQVIPEGSEIYRVDAGPGDLIGTLLAAQAQLAKDQASLHALLSPTPAAAVEVQAQEQQVQAQQQQVQAQAEQAKGRQQQIQAQEQQVRAQEQQVQAEGQQVQAQEQRIEADQAKQQSDQQSKEEQVVSAPAEGEITSLDVSVGQAVQVGTPLFALTSPDAVQVQTSVPETDLSQIYLGEKVAVDTKEQGTLQAVVSTIGFTSSQTDSQEALYPVTLTLENPPSGLRPGMQVTALFREILLYEAGTLSFPDAQSVTAPLAGTVASISATAGDAVQAGATVVRLADPGLATTLASDSAQTATDKAQLAQDRSQLAAAQSQLASDKAQVASDQEQVLTDAAQIAAANAQLASDKSQLQQLQQPTPPQAAEVSALQAQIAADQQSVQQAQNALGDENCPAVLLEGALPAYRDLQEGESGPDVAELNAALVGLHDATPAQLNPRADVFGGATRAAVRRLQAHLGISRTGALRLGQAVFLPATGIRITSLGSTATLGAAAEAGQSIFEATSNLVEVVATADESVQSDLRIGDAATFELPDGSIQDGRVTAVQPASDASTSVEVDIAPVRPEALGMLNGVAVDVWLTTSVVRDALAVPMTALLAQAGGGYTVEVVGTGGKRHLVRVTLGMFDDSLGLVQISGAGIRAGERVVVAGT